MTKSLLIAALLATAASLSFAQTPAPAKSMAATVPMEAAASKPAHDKKHDKKHDQMHDQMHDKKAAAGASTATPAAKAVKPAASAAK